MTPFTKATLLSALVFPGAGQLLLKRYYRAVSLAAIALFAVYILVISAINKALEISNKILSGEVAPDIATISKLITASSSTSDASQINVATILLIISWLLAIIDAWFIKHNSKVKN